MDFKIAFLVIIYQQSMKIIKKKNNYFSDPVQTTDLSVVNKATKQESKMTSIRRK
jgi:hypothetical protein